MLAVDDAEAAGVLLVFRFRYGGNGCQGLCKLTLYNGSSSLRPSRKAFALASNSGLVVNLGFEPCHELGSLIRT